MNKALAATTLTCLLTSACGGPDFDALGATAPGQPRTTSSWPAYGGEDAAKYASNSDLSRENVAQLEPAWVYRTGVESTVFQTTPILVEGRLVFCAPRNQVIALDPLNGAELWRFDPQIRQGGYANEVNCRGVAQAQTPVSQDCPVRILTATNDARLIALSARTGKPCADFGDREGNPGEVDLTAGVGALREPGEYQVVSPPAVVANVAVVGSAISDNQRVDAPSGVVRGYDTLTGELRWAFDFAPPGFDPAKQRVSDAGYALGSPNVWAPIAVDAARELVFLPTGNPAPDYFRNAEPDLDYYGSSVVALRASTGQYVWHFNTVINDFWDFDLSAAPSLADLEIQGEMVPALIQSTKMGFIFVLHRETGKPLLPVEYQSVPTEGPLREQLSEVQPFPPPAFRVSRSYERGGSILGLCDNLETGARSGPVYTPITEDWTIGLPSNMGATNWGGVAVDPVRGLIAVRTSSVPFRTRLISREDAGDLINQINSPDTSAADRASAWSEFYTRYDLPDGVELASQRGTPYLMARHVMIDPTIGLPCSTPPFGEIMVIDLATQSQIWRSPHGTSRDKTGIGLNIGMPGVGGPLVTNTGLIFVGGTFESMLRAYDLETGEELWSGSLPHPGNATPMTYSVTTDAGQQPFVVIAAGGDQRSGIGGSGDYLVAFSLPD